MGVDIDSFLNKIDKKEESKEEKISQEATENKKINIDFDKSVISNFKEISSEIKEKDLLQLKEIYEDLKKFDETMPSKFLSIQNIGSNTLDMLNSQYSTRLLETLENNARYYASKIKENNLKIEEDLISKEYKISLGLLKENKQFLQKYPEEFANEKHELFMSVKKYELKIHQEIRNFKISQASIIKKELLKKIKETKTTIESNSIEDIEFKLKELEINLQKIPVIFRSIFTDENIIIQKTIVSGHEKIIELKNKQFNQKEKELKITQDKFQNSIIKKDLNSALLLYNEILLLFEDLPNTNFKAKNTYLAILSKLHGQLNSLYVNSNVELLLRSYSNSKIIEEARNYIDHIELTKKISPENVSLIYKKLKDLPHSSHIEQDTMLKKYEILLQKITEEETQNNFEETNNKENNTIQKENESEIINKAVEYLKFVKDTQNLSEEMIKKNISNLKKIHSSENTKKILDKYEKILEKITKKEHSILDQSNHNKIDKNVANEVELLFLEMKKTSDKNEKGILYKKILFYLDLINLPESKKISIKKKIKNIYERD